MDSPSYNPRYAMPASRIQAVNGAGAVTLAHCMLSTGISHG